MESQQINIMGGKKSQSADHNITSLPEPLTTFLLFPRLPIDLRLYIYRIATPYERFVPLQAIDNTDSGDDEEELAEWQQPWDEDYRNSQTLERVLQEYLMDNKERGMHFSATEDSCSSKDTTLRHPIPDRSCSAMHSSNSTLFVGSSRNEQ
jgi:hypothetical protein